MNARHGDLVPARSATGGKNDANLWTVEKVHRAIGLFIDEALMTCGSAFGRAARAALDGLLAHAQWTDERFARLEAADAPGRYGELAPVDDRLAAPWPGNTPRRLPLWIFSLLLHRHNPLWEGVPLATIPTTVNTLLRRGPVDAQGYRLRLEHSIVGPDGRAAVFVFRAPINGGGS